MKLSDLFRRPPRVALPFNVVVNDLERVLQDLNYDFSLEESVVRNAAEQRRIWEEAEKTRKSDEEKAGKNAKEDKAAAAAVSTNAASSNPTGTDISSPSNINSTNANNNAAARPATIRTARPQVPPRPHPSSLPSPLLREVTAEKILQPQTLEGARPARPPSTILPSSLSTTTPSVKTISNTGSAPSSSISPSAAPVAAASVDVGAAVFNVADWERCEDPFEIMERRTINDMEELKNVLESVSSTQINTADDGAESAGNGAAASEPAKTEMPQISEQSAEKNETPSNFNNAEVTESSNAEAEVLSNVERPPSYDEVICEGASGGNDINASTENAVVMGLQNLQSSPALKKNSEMSSPSTPTSTGVQSIPNSLVGSPSETSPESAETAIKMAYRGGPSTSSNDIPVTGVENVGKGAGNAAAATSLAAMTPTTPSATFPEYVSLPDFPSLSEADLPTVRAENYQEKPDFIGPVFEETPAPQPEDPPAAVSTFHLPDLYGRLSPTLKMLVDKLVDMGFDVGVTSRAAEHFGADEKQVIDHLCSVSLLADEGHSVEDAEEALHLNEGKDKLARKFLLALTQLRQFGFEEAKIKAALVASGNDTEKALDQLMVT